MALNDFTYFPASFLGPDEKLIGCPSECQVQKNKRKAQQEEGC